MKCKRILAVGLIVVALTGCSTGAPSTEQIDGLNEKLVRLEAENQKLEESIEALEAQLTSLREENNQLVEELVTMTKDTLTIYTRDADTWALEQADSLIIDKGVSVSEKLEGLINKLSESQFEGLPLELQEIAAINGDQIAVINLKDGNMAWTEQYFQGSLGAELTQATLQETLLQRDYQGKWVDGIKLLYNGESFVSDHMILGEIIYR